MIRRWRAWKRRQRSQISYAVVPAPPRITSSGLKSTCRIVEIRSQSVL